MAPHFLKLVTKTCQHHTHHITEPQIQHWSHIDSITYITLHHQVNAYETYWGLQFQSFVSIIYSCNLKGLILRWIDCWISTMMLLSLLTGIAGSWGSQAAALVVLPNRHSQDLCKFSITSHGKHTCLKWPFPIPRNPKQHCWRFPVKVIIRKKRITIW